MLERMEMVAEVECECWAVGFFWLGEPFGGKGMVVGSVSRCKNFGFISDD